MIRKAACHAGCYGRRPVGCVRESRANRAGFPAHPLPEQKGTLCDVAVSFGAAACDAVASRRLPATSHNAPFCSLRRGAAPVGTRRTPRYRARFSFSRPLRVRDSSSPPIAVMAVACAWRGCAARAQHPPRQPRLKRLRLSPLCDHRPEGGARWEGPQRLILRTLQPLQGSR